MRWRCAATIIWSGLASAVAAAPTQSQYQVGQIFEISRDVETAETGGDGFRSSSTDRDMLEERVVGIGPSGLELEYDLPKSTSAEGRARQWQLPARVLRPPTGPMQLLNRPDMTARAAAWLKAAGMTDAACGHWYVTWNAFRIECDPQSVVKMIETFDAGPEKLAADDLYMDAQALRSAPLKVKAGAPGSAVLYVEMAVDPDAFRQGEAQADLLTAEMIRKPVALEAALHARAAEDISGTITVTFQIDEDGHVQRQTKVTVVNVKWQDGNKKTRTVTQTLERKLVGD
jgi:hypothetical protein